MKSSVKIQLLLLSVQILLIATFIFAGCNISNNIEPNSEQVNTSQETAIDTLNQNKYFISVGCIDGYEFMYDKYTKIMYVQYSGGYFMSMTVLYNSDGTVMTYNDWNNLESDNDVSNNEINGGGDYNKGR